MEIVWGFKMFNLASAIAQLNFRSWLILCTTLYKSPIQASNFGGTFGQLFLWMFLGLTKKFLVSSRPTGPLFPKIENFFWKCTPASTICMCVFPLNCVFLHVVNQTSITSPDSSLHENVFVNFTLHCQEHVELAQYACVRKMAEVCCVCAGTEALGDLEFLQKWKVVLPMCDMCGPLKKAPTRQSKKKWQLHQLCSLNVSPEKLIVWLTCQRSYPTSHSCTLSSSDPGITLRLLTMVRNISFSVSSLDHVQRAT